MRLSNQCCHIRWTHYSTSVCSVFYQEQWRGGIFGRKYLSFRQRITRRNVVNNWHAFACIQGKPAVDWFRLSKHQRFIYKGRKRERMKTVDILKTTVTPFFSLRCWLAGTWERSQSGYDALVVDWTVTQENNFSCLCLLWKSFGVY